MPGSRLLPTEQRSSLPAAPTTSRWWRTHVLVRSWLNRHRRRWLAPLLLCAPPVGVAMVWAGATRPGHSRRWLTAGAAVWSLVIVLAIALLTVPGASPADAGVAPAAVAGGPALTAPTPSSTPTRDAAAVAADEAAVRAAAERAAGVGAAAVDPAAGSTAGSAAGTGGAEPGGDGAPAPVVAPIPGRTSAPASSAPAPSSAPTGAPTTSKPKPAPTTPKPTTPKPPKPTPPPGPVKPPTKPSIPTANPFTSCSVEGSRALSPNGFSLRCYRTPLGLFWLWG